MAKRAAAAVPVIEHDSEELVQVRTDGDLVNQFVANLRAFFSKAEVLESRSKNLLGAAVQMQLPKTGEEDADLQRFIQNCNAHQKSVTEHWGVTAVFSRFHKRLTAARSRGTEPAERAAAIGNQLHQRYVAETRRREQEETDRRRREEEARAQESRRRELEVLEAQRLKAEEAMPELTEREEEFVHQFTDGRYAGNAFRCAQEAGYAQPRSAAERLMASPKIQAALQVKEDARRAKEQAEAVAAQPLRIETPIVPAVSEVQKVGTEREFYSAEIIDADAFVRAVVDMKLGIPLDTLAPVQAKLNGYAREWKEQLSRWPGIRVKRETKVY